MKYGNYQNIKVGDVVYYHNSTDCENVIIVNDVENEFMVIRDCKNLKERLFRYSELFDRELSLKKRKGS